MSAFITDAQLLAREAHALLDAAASSRPRDDDGGHPLFADPRVPAWLRSLLAAESRSSWQDLLDVLDQIAHAPRLDFGWLDLARSFGGEYREFPPDPRPGATLVSWGGTARGFLREPLSEIGEDRLRLYERTADRIRKEIGAYRQRHVQPYEAVEDLLLNDSGEDCAKSAWFRLVRGAAGPGIQWLSRHERPHAMVAYDWLGGHMRILVWETEGIDTDDHGPCLYLEFDRRGRLAAITDHWGREIWRRPSPDAPLSG